MHKKTYNCKRCIYQEACPCGYHNGNAFCSTFYQPQTKEMLLQCLSTAPNQTQAWTTLEEYLRGYDEFQFEKEPLSVAQLVPLTAGQLQVLARRRHTKAGNLQAAIDVLRLTETQELTVAEYAVLLALIS